MTDRAKEFRESLGNPNDKENIARPFSLDDIKEMWPSCGEAIEHLRENRFTIEMVVPLLESSSEMIDSIQCVPLSDEERDEIVSKVLGANS